MVGRPKLWSLTSGWPWLLLLVSIAGETIDELPQRICADWVRCSSLLSPRLHPPPTATTKAAFAATTTRPVPGFAGPDLVATATEPPLVAAIGLDLAAGVVHLCLVAQDVDSRREPSPVTHRAMPLTPSTVAHPPSPGTTSRELQHKPPVQGHQHVMYQTPPTTTMTSQSLVAALPWRRRCRSNGHWRYSDKCEQIAGDVSSQRLSHPISTSASQ
uniref:Secreted protein n=1 Tax=Arundo donax TaxID=35708 RepID=A0A0A9BCC8_ARUDO